MNAGANFAGHLAEKCGGTVFDAALALAVVLGIANWAGWL